MFAIKDIISLYRYNEIAQKAISACNHILMGFMNSQMVRYQYHLSQLI